LTSPRIHKAGHRRFNWHDTSRSRPVLADFWYPSADAADERVIPYGLGQGSVVPNGEPARATVPFPLVVFSPGAFGSASNYSWLAEYLARRGVGVLGLSHYGESWLYGPETIDFGSVTRLWIRPADCTFALSELLREPETAALVDRTRISAAGHSSGGATALALGGAIFEQEALWAYCRTTDSRIDKGCDYARRLPDVPVAPPDARESFRDARILSIVALDPAAGPGHSVEALARVHVPVLIIGSRDNDFLPFEHHAGRYSAHLPNASLVTLEGDEGHFVYLNTCASDLVSNGVPLCVDRPGVDRAAVHARVAPLVLTFLEATWRDAAGSQ
jgi:predicted dienelactone hydrolase